MTITKILALLSVIALLVALPLAALAQGEGEGVSDAPACPALPGGRQGHHRR